MSDEVCIEIRSGSPRLVKSSVYRGFNKGLIGHAMRELDLCDGPVKSRLPADEGKRCGTFNADIGVDQSKHRTCQSESLWAARHHGIQPSDWSKEGRPSIGRYLVVATTIGAAASCTDP
jgi:hypothetical protein